MVRFMFFYSLIISDSSLITETCIVNTVPNGIGYCYSTLYDFVNH